MLWDVATQKPIGAPLELEADMFVSAALSPDGKRLYAISTGDDGISFDMSPEAWKRHACLVAGARSVPASGNKRCPSGPTRPSARATDPAAPAGLPAISKG